MKPKIYVDGQEGTTGLEIHEYLGVRDDLEILKIDSAKRKDTEARRAMLNEADIAFLCLPESASREAVTLVTSPRTRLIDASVAHRVDPAWTYGLPELNPQQRAKIIAASRVTVPGCHATAAILTLYPVLQAGIITKDYPVSLTSLTGYSGGGRKLIEKYQQAEAERTLRSPRPYALGLNHKHLPEMQQVLGLTYPPIFTPVVSDFYRGLAVSIPLAARTLKSGTTAASLHVLLSDYYAHKSFVRVMPLGAESNLEDGTFNVEGCNHTNRADLFVFSNGDQILLLSRLDNLGKGASGAAVQCMNLMLGVDEKVGLRS